MRSVLFRYQQKNELVLRNLLSKNICFLANRLFETDEHSVTDELMFKRPLIGAKEDH